MPSDNITESNTIIDQQQDQQQLVTVLAILINVLAHQLHLYYLVSPVVPPDCGKE